MRVTTAVAAIGTGAATEVRVTGGREEGVGVTVTDTWGEIGRVDVACVEATEECGHGAGQGVVLLEEGQSRAVAKTLDEQRVGGATGGVVG